MSKYKGIDISEHNKNINYAKVAKQIDFVIIREGCRMRMDYLFQDHVKGFKACGTPIIGVYHFIYALNNQAAKDEALSCIANVEKAGLPKTTTIWCDFEYDTIDYAKKQGVTLGKNECNLFTKTFCDTVKAAGYPTGIYTNIDYYKNYYTKDTLSKYDIWLADYSGDPDYDCLIQQYTSKLALDGYAGTFDANYYYGELPKNNQNGSKTETKEEELTSGVTADDVLKCARSYLGCNEYDGSHKKIIDLYNSHKPLARGYAVQYTDSWCDTFVSAVFIKLNATDMIGGTECGVEEHVKLFKAKGIWLENGSITPKPGDIIVFNWDDSTQPNDGYSDHIGFVEKVSGKTITTIEGNYKDSVARREITVGWGYIRGYARPKYGTVVPQSSSSSGQSAGSSSNEATKSKSMVSRGSKGADVKYLQQLLNKVGYRLDVDGEFGAKTYAALTSYQNKNGLAVDGICGPKTWASLEAKTKSSSSSTTTAKKTVAELAKEVLAGKWGNQPNREKNLTAAGYDYAAVQKEVNRLLAK